MNNRIHVAALACALASPAFAADYTDTAEVISTIPIYGSISEPRQQCWYETVTTYQEAPRSYGGAVLGTITGGLIGSTIGSGNGRVAAAAAGAAIGALVGNRADERNSYQVAVPQQVQRCQAVDTRREGITGYQVTYNYNGRNSTVILPYDPGPRVTVGISVTGAAGVPDITPQSAYTPQSGQVTYVDANGQVPIWAIKPYKRPRPAVEND